MSIRIPVGPTRLRTAKVLLALASLAIACAPGAQEPQTQLRQLQEEAGFLEKHCKNVADALVHARHAANFSFKPNHNANEGCIIAPTTLNVTVLTAAAKGASMLLSPFAAATLDSAVDKIAEGSRTACISPIARAKSQYDSMLGAAQDAARELEEPREMMRKKVVDVDARMSRVRALPKGLKEFESQRHAVMSHAGLRLGNCRTWISDRF
jgi:hypothetical protein